MKTDLYQTLLSSTTEPQLGETVVKAIDFLKSAVITREHVTDSDGQPAKQISDLYAFRKRIGYWKEEAIVGLKETIESLAHVDGNVRLGTFETDRGFVALWLDEHGSIVGVMIANIITKSS